LLRLRLLLLQQPLLRVHELLVEQVGLVDVRLRDRRVEGRDPRLLLALGAGLRQRCGLALQPVPLTAKHGAVRVVSANHRTFASARATIFCCSLHFVHHVAHCAPGVITLTQPKVLEAKIRGSKKGFQWVILGLERTLGFLKGVQRGPMGPPGPRGLAALPRAVLEQHVRGGLVALLHRDVQRRVAEVVARAERHARHRHEELQARQRPPLVRLPGLETAEKGG
jgi:hypothetical protein